MPEFWRKNPVAVFYDLDGERVFYEQFNGKQEAMILKTGLIDIQIDLNYSKNRLMEEIEALVDNLKKSHDEKLKQIGNRREEYKRKYHFDNFNIYLQVWDLREKERLKWSDIGNKLFPDMENKVQTARNYHKAASMLIEKGIDLYVN